ncbi:MAG: 2Fe-2S iron-sulfur cluster binding domain-containing protein [Desulfatibacillaceae bacterium]|nr:2Fe-2S iron-sulfur cluster binding domain-containing protein [Desulfatibacillaceae bacterium]
MTQVLIGVLAISALTAFLAFLLEMAHAFVLNYGEVTLSINKGDKKFTVQGGSSLLGTLMDNSIFVPSACGGRASCGLCKVTVTEGGGPILPTETPYLEKDEQDAGIRLSCQVKVRSDMAIEMDPALFNIKEYKTVAKSIKDLTATIKELRLKLVEPPEISFKPGQFVQFRTPEYQGSPEPVYRAYSIASSAKNKNEIVLCITKVKGGLATTFVHEFLKQDDEVLINGPYGEFYLRDSDSEMIMIATGSGLAPLMSILYQMAEDGIDRKATLFFGTYRPNDLFYVDELKGFEKKLKNFTFVPVVSGATPEDNWQGETGMVTDPVKKLLQASEAPREAYLCGNPLMIDAAVKLLQENGVKQNQIYYDKFA